MCFQLFLCRFSVIIAHLSASLTVTVWSGVLFWRMDWIPIALLLPLTKQTNPARVRSSPGAPSSPRRGTSGTLWLPCIWQAHTHCAARPKARADRAATHLFLWHTRQQNTRSELRVADVALQKKNKTSRSNLILFWRDGANCGALATSAISLARVPGERRI